MASFSRSGSQQTVRRPVVVTGRGYWSGRENRVEIRPAAAGEGVVFVRHDRPSPAVVPATLGSRIEATARTNLAADGVRVEMVEHLLSALAALGVDCCRVSLTADELPRLDGSSLAFVEAIDAAGVVSLGVPREPIVVRERLRVGDDEAWLEALPPRFPGLSVDYVLDYGPGPIGRQEFSIELTPDAYRRELAAARTFITLEEAGRLRAAGLGLDVSMRDLVVFSPDGPIDNPLRWPDECVRHKVLDLVGDLALAGRPIHGHVRAYRSGHRLNAELAAGLRSMDVEQAACMAG
ncbi:MAG: UDP-3-O-[3-hydroxymyristoyl] N-acetylglucosamine deacetylase [Planctomycetia bacterium]|nr:UDP-3-O-[3-hydroxymyristoyl] N-acetylglucosamine deacetylase [Planctomycetia bacterium]